MPASPYSTAACGDVDFVLQAQQQQQQQVIYVTPTFLSPDESFAGAVIYALFVLCRLDSSIRHTGVALSECRRA